jgi:putative nucleotidyltransferase with HDIG domain
MNGRVLIVDDEAGIRKVLNLRLGSLGYETCEAENGLKALDVLKDRPFDAVLCDIKMPEMDGLEMIAKLRQSDPITPVIMLTGFIDLETAVEVMKRGAFDYLTKPVHSDALFLAVEKAVDYKRVLVRNRSLEEEKQRYHEELKQRVTEQTRIIRSMFDLANRLNSLDSMNLILESVLDAVCEFIPSRRVFVMLLDKDGTHFEIARSRGISEDQLRDLRIPADNGVCSGLFHTGGVRIVNDGNSREASEVVDSLEGLAKPPFMQAALMGARSRLGLIHIFEKSDGTPFSEKEAEILSYIADSATVAINNQLYERRLEESYLATIRALAMAIEAKDPYTRGHSERVAELSVRVAERLGLPEDEVRIMRFAGALHDVGKIGVPGSVLTKPERLTPEEFEQIRQHPVIGEKMIREAEFLTEARGIIRQHHERIDGTGYPDGLKGHEICLGARIMALADAYDAMTTDRTYRKAMAREDALKEMRRVSGTQFDPECLKVFLDVIEDLDDTVEEPPIETEALRSRI